jgi:hypothetical protein
VRQHSRLSVSSDLLQEIDSQHVRGLTILARQGGVVTHPQRLGKPAGLLQFVSLRERVHRNPRSRDIFQGRGRDK